MKNSFAINRLVAGCAVFGAVALASAAWAASDTFSEGEDQAAASSAEGTASTEAGAAQGWDKIILKTAANRIEGILDGSRAIDSPLLDGEVESRFWAAASLVTRFSDYPYMTLLAYDPITRCAMTARIDVSRDDAPITFTGFARSGETTRAASVPSVAMDSGRSMAAFFVGSELTGDSGCKRDIETAYGSAFVAAQADLAKLTEHSISVLRGGPAGSAEAPLDEAAIEQTVAGRERAAPMARHPQFLGAIRTENATIILVGDPRKPTRWATQYQNLGPSRWRFEGASDVGMSLL